MDQIFLGPNFWLKKIRTKQNLSPQKIWSKKAQAQAYHKTKISLLFVLFCLKIKHITVFRLFEMDNMDMVISYIISSLCKTSFC